MLERDSEGNDDRKNSAAASTNELTEDIGRALLLISKELHRIRVALWYLILCIAFAAIYFASQEAAFKNLLSSGAGSNTIGNEQRPSN